MPPGRRPALPCPTSSPAMPRDSPLCALFATIFPQVLHRSSVHSDLSGETHEVSGPSLRLSGGGAGEMSAPTSIRDFSLVKVIGQGAFAKGAQQSSARVPLRSACFLFFQNFALTVLGSLPLIFVIVCTCVLRQTSVACEAGATSEIDGGGGSQWTFRHKNSAVFLPEESVQEPGAGKRGAPPPANNGSPVRREALLDHGSEHGV